MHAKPNCWAARHALSRSARSLNFLANVSSSVSARSIASITLRHSIASLLMGQGNPQSGDAGYPSGYRQPYLRGRINGRNPL